MALAPRNSGSRQKSRSNNNTQVQSADKQALRQAEETCRILVKEQDQLGKALVDAEVRLVDARLVLSKAKASLGRIEGLELAEDLKAEILQTLSDIHRVFPQA